MALGEKIRQARLEAGLSQRELCGDVITRNMLSQIENGSARPSMDTLRHFASRLGKSVSYFLEEDAVLSPNGAVMDRARDAADARDWEGVRKALADYREPDALFSRERQLLEELATLELAARALEEGRGEYARALLEEEIPGGDGYQRKLLERRRLLVLGKAVPEKLQTVCSKLPSADEELLLRAKGAMEAGDVSRSARLLDAMERREGAAWRYLRGCAYLEACQFTKAAASLLKAEQTMPEQCIPKLEQCYRELGNYEKAYHYACKQKRR